MRSYSMLHIEFLFNYDRSDSDAMFHCEATNHSFFKQGRLEPVQAFLKKNKRGLGAAEIKKSQNTGDQKNLASDKTNDKVSCPFVLMHLDFIFKFVFLLVLSNYLTDVYPNVGFQLSKKSKAKLSKKMKKAQEIEKRLQENEFQRAFFREFWPDNV